MTASKANVIWTYMVGLLIFLNGCTAMPQTVVQVQPQLPLVMTSAWRLADSWVIYQTGDGGSTLMVLTQAEQSSAAAQIEACSKFHSITDLMAQLRAVPVSLSSLPIAIQNIASGILPSADWLTWSFVVMPSGAGNLMQLEGQNRPG
jgi:hypothetical protein